MADLLQELRDLLPLLRSGPITDFTLGHRDVADRLAAILDRHAEAEPASDLDRYLRAESEVERIRSSMDDLWLRLTDADRERLDGRSPEAEPVEWEVYSERSFRHVVCGIIVWISRASREAPVFNLWLDDGSNGRITMMDRIDEGEAKRRGAILVRALRGVMR